MKFSLPDVPTDDISIFSHADADADPDADDDAETPSSNTRSYTVCNTHVGVNHRPSDGHL